MHLVLGDSGGSRICKWGEGKVEHEDEGAEGVGCGEGVSLSSLGEGSVGERHAQWNFFDFRSQKVNFSV